MAFTPGGEIARRARVVVTDRATRRTYEAQVDLSAGEVTAWRELEGVLPPILDQDFARAAEAALADPRFVAALRRRGIEDLSHVQVDPLSAGHFPQNPPGRRIVWATPYLKPHPQANAYSSPIENLRASVDLDSGEVVDVIDRDPIVPISTADGDYETEEAVGGWRDDLAPLDIVQPDGPGFTLDGHVLRWQDWSLHVALHPVDGLVLSDVRFRDGSELRQILYRAGPQRDGRPVRRRARRLLLAHVLRRRRVRDGAPRQLPGARVRLPRRDPLPRRRAGRRRRRAADDPERRSASTRRTPASSGSTRRCRGAAHVRRSRRLVVSFFATVGNYDYGFYWSLYQDGTIELEAKLTGIVLTRGVTPDQELASATRLAPDLAAPHHQHLFNVRLDMAVDGFRNTVHEVDLVAAQEGPENEHRQAMVTRVTPIRRESEGRRHIDPAAARTWHVVAPGRRNHVGEPTGYKLVPFNGPTMLASPDSSVGRRAGFAHANLWVTRYHPDELHAAGDHPNQHPGGAGLPEWIGAGPLRGGRRRRALAHVRRLARGAPGGLAGDAGRAHRVRAAAGRLLRPQPGDAGAAERAEGPLSPPLDSRGCPRPPRCTAATARGPSTRSSARSTSSARCATRWSRTRSTTRTCSSARAGTGKTSMAKILAACLNCEHGPTTQPCGRCESCVAIAARHLDGRHRDGRGVQQLRRRHPRPARAASRSPPSPGRHKVYILDEAHMLSPQAWNAFLKTLEEPPPHTVFVLATTEAQKVLPTVVDRCHRFDFTRPTVEQIAGVLRRVSDEEGIDVPRRGARAARPARDRLVPRRARHARAARHLLGPGDHDRRRARRARRGGRRPAVRPRWTPSRRATRARRCWRPRSSSTPGAIRRVFVRDLEAHARDLMVVQALGELPAELRLTPDRDARLADQASRVGRARRHAPARPARRRAGGRPQRRRCAHAARARAREGGLAEVDPSRRALLSRDRGPRESDARRQSLRPAGRVGRAAAHPGARGGSADAAVRAPSPRSPPRRPPSVGRPRRRVQAVWPAVLDHLKSTNVLCASVLAESRPVALDGGELVVAFPPRLGVPAPQGGHRRVPRVRPGGAARRHRPGAEPRLRAARARGAAGRRRRGELGAGPHGGGVGRALRDRVRRRGDRARGATGGDSLMPQPPNLRRCSSRPRR